MMKFQFKDAQAGHCHPWASLYLYKIDGDRLVDPDRDGVQEFVSYKAFEALCDHPVLCKANENWQAGINHIAYSKVDLVLIAPATANTINKLAWGVCDNVFLEVLNAAFAHAKVVIAPAANPALLENNITKNYQK